VNVRLDHLVLAAPTLEEGVQWAERTLGVTPAPGGRHALMSTHNRLLKLDGSDDAYLELIAVDPEAPDPGRARWFGLDDPALQASLRAGGPRLVHWVARTTNLDMHRFGLLAAGLDPGTTLAAERATPAGLLRWRVTVPDDGRPRAGGALPTLIEWQGPHPAPALPASGIALQELEVHGLPARAAQVLQPLGVRMDETARAPALVARLATPRGIITLASTA
jgi:hypothetical protein